MAEAEIFEQSRAYFLAPVSDLLDHAEGSAVMIHGPSRVYVERKGKVEAVPNRFGNDRELLSCARNIAQYS